MQVSGNDSSKKRSAIKFVKLISALILAILIPLISFVVYETHSHVGEIKQLLSIGSDNGKQILGFKGQQRYLLAFQNSAEARGTGGLIGAYAIVRIDHGRISIEQSGSNIDLINRQVLPLSMPADFVKLYGNDPAMWLNSNLSPHFPNAALIWMKLWQMQGGKKLDGVMAIDPTVVSYILRTVGPIQSADGDLVTADNVVKLTLSDMYVKYETNNLERKKALVDLLTKVFAKVQASSAVQKLQIMKALLEPYKENRILFYSTNTKTQAAVAKTQLGGVLSRTAPNEYRAVVENVDGNKMDYYLDREIKIQDLSCSPDRITELTFAAKNTFSGKGSLPNYVWGRLDIDKPEGDGGSHRIKILVYGPSGSTVAFATDGTGDDLPGGVYNERGRPVFVTNVVIEPNEIARVKIAFITYNSDYPEVVTQPLVLGTKVQIGKVCK